VSGTKNSTVFRLSIESSNDRAAEIAEGLGDLLKELASDGAIVNVYVNDVQAPMSKRVQPNTAEAEVEAADISSFDIESLRERIEATGATSDMLRATIYAQAARDARLPGIDAARAEALTRELGLQSPADWRGTFSNARTRNLLVHAGHGAYAPTKAGARFAKTGEWIRRPRKRRER
jgi:ubiquinone/menaquinone biosynthesis C-methylase UbiE